ncbi:MAG: acylphosphatase [Ardenticatenia bacterium]|nr:acylphosphatase [Ardenticatenia bacterium]
MSAPGRKRIHGFISGRVQGVFFRVSMQQEALRLGVGGWVRNLPDGRVEFVAEGPPEAVDALVRWAHRGPPAARVTHVDVDEEPPTGGQSRFEVRRTPFGWSP